MRAIDNMTPQEIEILQLKGMTSPRTAGERRHAFIEKHGVTGATLESREPAPNKAQHSPLPWVHTHEDGCINDADGNLIASEIRYDEGKLIVCAVNHADKLAEALRDCETTPGALAERSHEYALRRLATITETARAALAAYESEAQ